MSPGYPTWKDRSPEQVTCIRCLEVRPKDDLDRLLWCDECRERARARAARRGWLAGAVVALVLSLWIWLWVRPDPDLVLGGWIATVVAAFWIGARVAREIDYGVQRFSNRKATDAAPPAATEDAPREEDP